MPHRGIITHVREIDKDHAAAKEVAVLPEYGNALVSTLISTAFYHRNGLADKSIPRFGEHKFIWHNDLDKVTDWSVEIRSETCIVYEIDIPQFVQDAGLIKSFIDIVSSHLELYYPDCKVVLGNVLPPCQLTIRVEKKEEV